MRNQIQIMLGRDKVNLYERSAKEVFAISRYVQAQGGLDVYSNIALSIDIIQTSLKPNYNDLIWLRIIGIKLICLQPLKWLKYKRLFSTKWLYKNLSTTEIKTFTEIIFFELEKNNTSSPDEEKKK